MRFALLGDHPDGLAAARALAASGRHGLVVYSGPAAGLEILARDGLQPRRVGDVEETLADPSVEAVIVAGAPSSRAAQLRRALQSERHVLCVHPVDPSPDVGYEAAQLQSDVRRVLLPLLPEAFHPGIRRLAQLAQAARGPQSELPRCAAHPLPPGFPRLIETERWSPEELLLDGGDPGAKPGLPGWDVLRLLGGEINDVFAIATSDELAPGEPVQLCGRYVKGGLWQATLLPWQSRPYWRLALVAAQGRTELVFAEGWPGPARLTFIDENGQTRVEEWPAQNPWTALVEAFDDAVDVWRSRRPAPLPGETERWSLTDETVGLGWLDAIRAQELDAAARRSVERGRAYSLDFPEATEEASFKGAMTLVGCSLLWISLLLVILSAWLPQLGWAILPFFGIFLVMQLLRWVVPGGRTSSQDPTKSGKTMV
jgi:predicted dehydrogenase